MANATEQNQFDQAVRLIEPGDSVVVGPGAPVNQPLQALANRTLLLKNQTEALQTASDTKAAASTATSQNTVPKNGHTHAIDTARTDRAGIVRLDNAISEAEDTAATPKAVKTALDQARAAAATADLKVSLSDNQTVTGQKTFTAETQFQSGIRLSANPTH